jgi:hypothetical protein
MKSTQGKALSWVAVLLLASCASLMGPRNVEIPIAQLQDSIAKKFPFNNRYLELLDINVSNPRISVQPETNRITTSMDTLIAPPFLARAWKGNLAISGNLKFDPARNALVLGDPRMEQFTVDGLDATYGRQITKIGNLLAGELLQDMPLYTFKPEDLRYGGANFVLSKITTKPNSLVVTFEPAR